MNRKSEDGRFFFNVTRVITISVVTSSRWQCRGSIRIPDHVLPVNGMYLEQYSNRIQIGWNKFRQLVPLLTNRDISLIRRGRLYSSRVWSSMLHGWETWPVRKENEVALQRAEMRMVRWMCNVKVKDRVPNKELRKWPGIDAILRVSKKTSHLYNLL